MATLDQSVLKPIAGVRVLVLTSVKLTGPDHEASFCRTFSAIFPSLEELILTLYEEERHTNPDTLASHLHLFGNLRKRSFGIYNS